MPLAIPEKPHFPTSDRPDNSRGCDSGDYWLIEDGSEVNRVNSKSASNPTALRCPSPAALERRHIVPGFPRGRLRRLRAAGFWQSDPENLIENSV